MPICQNIQINYNGGIYGNGTEADLAIDEVVGVNHANCVTSYGGQIVEIGTVKEVIPAKPAQEKNGKTIPTEHHIGYRIFSFDFYDDFYHILSEHT